LSKLFSPPAGKPGPIPRRLNSFESAPACVGRILPNPVARGNTLFDEGPKTGKPPIAPAEARGKVGGVRNNPPLPPLNIEAMEASAGPTPPLAAAPPPNPPPNPPPTPPPPGWKI